MRFIDLPFQQARIRTDIEGRIQKVLDHGQYIMGPEVEALERTLADYVGVNFALGCGSGTDALLLALMAYDIGPGDAVLTSPFTFMATAEVIALLGATPVFVDIDPATFNLDPSHLRRALDALEGQVPSLHPLPKTVHGESLRPRGIITVDLFGLPADHDPIRCLARERSLFVIEDAAQSFGATYRGKRTCGLGHIGCTSFFPSKPLGAYGDGGMCFTDDREVYERLTCLRIHGQGQNKYDNIRIGINGRLDTLQAAILQAKFELFPEEMELRQQVAAIYAELLSGKKSSVKTPKIPASSVSAWAQYSVLAREGKYRADLQERLKTASIPTAVYYPKPLHLQPAFSGLGYGVGDFPASESCAQRIFSLPMHPYLKREDQERIAAVLNGA